MRQFFCQDVLFIRADNNNGIRFLSEFQFQHFHRVRFPAFDIVSSDFSLTVLTHRMQIHRVKDYGCRRSMFSTERKDLFRDMSPRENNHIKLLAAFGEECIKSVQEGCVKALDAELLYSLRVRRKTEQVFRDKGNLEAEFLKDKQ